MLISSPNIDHFELNWVIKSWCVLFLNSLYCEFTLHVVAWTVRFLNCYWCLLNKSKFIGVIWVKIHNKYFYTIHVNFPLLILLLCFLFRILWIWRKLTLDSAKSWLRYQICLWLRIWKDYHFPNVKICVKSILLFYHSTSFKISN